MALHWSEVLWMNKYTPPDKAAVVLSQILLVHHQYNLYGILCPGNKTSLSLIWTGSKRIWTAGIDNYAESTYNISGI